MTSSDSVNTNNVLIVRRSVAVHIRIPDVTKCQLCTCLNYNRYIISELYKKNTVYALGKAIINKKLINVTVIKIMYLYKRSRVTKIP